MQYCSFIMVFYRFCCSLMQYCCTFYLCSSTTVQLFIKITLSLSYSMRCCLLVLCYCSFIVVHCCFVSRFVVNRSISSEVQTQCQSFMVLSLRLLPPGPGDLVLVGPLGELLEEEEVTKPEPLGILGVVVFWGAAEREVLDLHSERNI